MAMAIVQVQHYIFGANGHAQNLGFPPHHLPMYVAGTRLLCDRHFKKHHEKHRPFLAMFYRHNDDECLAFLHEWGDAVTELKQELGKATIDNRLVAVDCGRGDSKELCKNFRSHRCPSLTLYEEVTPHKAPHHFIREVYAAQLGGLGYTKEGVKHFVHEHKELFRPPDEDDDSDEAAMVDLRDGEELNLDAMREDDFEEGGKSEL